MLKADAFVLMDLCRESGSNAAVFFLLFIP